MRLERERDTDVLVIRRELSLFDPLFETAVLSSQQQSRSSRSIESDDDDDDNDESYCVLYTPPPPKSLARDLQ